LLKAELLRIMQEVGLEPDALGSLLPTLEAYGFLKRLKKPQDHLLADPVTWLTMVLGEFVSPVQSHHFDIDAGNSGHHSGRGSQTFATQQLELPLEQARI
jgi:hypothetical protein